MLVFSKCRRDWRQISARATRTAGLLACAIHLSSLAAHAGEAPRKTVLAHYMACCPQAGLQSSTRQYEDEIRAANENGIDGFAINFGSYVRSPSHLQVIERLYAAAAHFPNFNLLLSFDQSSPSEAVELIMKYASNPNSLRKNGRLVVSGWGQTPHWATEVRERARAHGIEIFLVPHMNYPCLRPE
ncbi:hypothetical protein CWO91_30300 [Bradyrhizobium genosp. SA-3]|uniref:endo-1,3-alpha-glucanase family glycosylhydrolase n=1 Tax=Bradyrhizobium genosp. SA-3 TaxID=508868 RepID=UPI00102A1F4A|nr:hypothetical protein CWO91_30300 [Bradyrhizobium genosp. SA-3]